MTFKIYKFNLKKTTTLQTDNEHRAYIVDYQLSQSKICGSVYYLRS